jgi:hypothetical protein
MPAMHEDMHEWAGEQDQIGQKPERMGPVIREDHHYRQHGHNEQEDREAVESAMRIGRPLHRLSCTQNDEFPIALPLAAAGPREITHQYLWFHAADRPNLG